MDLIKNESGSWVASGEGPLNPIVAKGATREDARMRYERIYGGQYAAAEAMTALSLLSEGRREKKMHDAGELTKELRS